MEIRAATLDDVLELHGKPFEHDMFGIVAEQDGVPVGMAGILEEDVLQLFAIVTPALRRSPKTMVRMAYWARDVMARQVEPVFSLADPARDVTSRFLEWVGLTYCETTEQGRLYVWTQ